MADIVEQFRRQDVEALLGDGDGPTDFGRAIGQLRIVEIRVTGRPLLLVDVVGQVLRDEAVKQHSEHVRLEVPAVNAAAQVVRDPPDGLVDLSTLGFFRHRCHVASHFQLIIGLVCGQTTAPVGRCRPTKPRRRLARHKLPSGSSKHGPTATLSPLRRRAHREGAT